MGGAPFRAPDERLRDQTLPRGIRSSLDSHTPDGAGANDCMEPSSGEGLTKEAPGPYNRAAMQELRNPSDESPLDVPLDAIVGRLQFSGSVDSLRELIQELSASWDDLTDAERRRLITKIERKSGELVKRTRLTIVPRNSSTDSVSVLPKADVYLSRLTWRELQTLGALMDGRATSQIAEGFGISETTVRTHVKSILAKLGVHSRLEAVAVARSRISHRRLAKRLA